MLVGFNPSSIPKYGNTHKGFCPIVFILVSYSQQQPCHHQVHLRKASPTFKDVLSMCSRLTNTTHPSILSLLLLGCSTPSMVHWFVVGMDRNYGSCLLPNAIPIFHLLFCNGNFNLSSTTGHIPSSLLHHSPS